MRSRRLALAGRAGGLSRALAGPSAFRPISATTPTRCGTHSATTPASRWRVTWRDAARSAELLGPHFDQIVAVLQRAATLGMLKFELA